MKIEWKGQIHIHCSVHEVFAYLLDFQRHAEWAQTVVKLEKVQGGDASGVGAVYRTFERQALQANRQPGEALLKGMTAKTLCTITEVVSNTRIAWHSHTVPKTGMYADWMFEFSSVPDGGMLLTQSTSFHQPGIMAAVFSLMFRGNLRAKSFAQFDASLRNIKLILERHSQSVPTVPHQNIAQQMA